MNFSVVFYMLISHFRNHLQSHTHIVLLFHTYYIYFRDTLWFDGKINSVNYDPPRNDTENRSDLIMALMAYSTKVEDVVS